MQARFCQRLVLLLVFEFSTSSGQTPECSNCDESKLSEEELRNLRLEFIKVQILSKLRLENPPNVTAQPLPDLLNLELLSESENEEEPEELFTIEDYYGKTREVVIFPSNSTSYICQTEINARCFQYLLTPEVSTSSVKTAELWVQEKRNSSTNSSLTYTILDVFTDADNFTTNTVIAESSYNASEWLKFDVTSAVLFWVESGELERNLEMVCDECDFLSGVDDDDQASFLRIRTDLQDLVHSRRRRNLVCTPNTTLCCKEIFNVSFEDIGWHRWIIKPDSYNANFCRGTCNSDISSARYFHTTVLRGFIQSHTADRRNLTLSLCCTPFHMKSLTVIYMTQERRIFRKTLPNMIAQSCDCA